MQIGGVYRPGADLDRTCQFSVYIELQSLAFTGASAYCADGEFGFEKDGYDREDAFVKAGGISGYSGRMRT